AIRSQPFAGLGSLKGRRRKFEGQGDPMRARTATGFAAATAIVLFLGAACSGGGHKAAPATTTAVVEASTTTTARPSASTTTHRSTTTLRAVTRATPPPPGPCCSATPHGPITVSFTGLASGQRVPNNGQVVPFTVTFTNNTTTNYQSVAPVAAAEHYDGAPGGGKVTAGSLQRYHASSG